MSAAENKLPDAKGTLSWLSLAIAVFNTQVPRWNPKTCGGGLNWQIFTFNKGYHYKNTISNGGFFNIAARLAKYTQNSTYIEWAEKAWDWERSVGLISQDYHFYDGTSQNMNCTEINHMQWTYNAGIHMAGAAALWNTSESLEDLNQAALWKGRLAGIIKATDVFFSQDGAPNVMIEIACERNGLCDDQDQPSFKAYLSRWMGYTMLTAPWTQETIMPKLRASAIAAAKQCGSGKSGCGLRWWQDGVNDGEAGVGEQMAALEVMQNLLVGEVTGPASEKTGGVSKNDPLAGTESGGSVADPDRITTGDRVGAVFLTAIAILATLGGGWLLIKDG